MMIPRVARVDELQSVVDHCWCCVFAAVAAAATQVIVVQGAVVVFVVALAGNKLFQGRFIAAIYDQPSMFVVLQWTLLNSGIALLGAFPVVAIIRVTH